MSTLFKIYILLYILVILSNDSLIVITKTNIAIINLYYTQ